MATQLEMVRLFKAQLELCAVKPDETLVVFAEGNIRADYAEAFLLAARELEVKGYQVTIPLRSQRSIRMMSGRTPIADNRPVIDALKQADIIIDLVGMLFSAEQIEICKTGTRILFVREPFDVLAQNFPDVDLRRRVEHGEALLAAAKTMHITSDAGTNVHYEFGQYPMFTQYGYTATPGRWDHMGTGQVLTQAKDGCVNGKVVLNSGDIINVFKRYVESPITFTIEGGRVVDISGKGYDADMLRTYMKSYDDPRAYAVSHIGWGLLKSAPWFHNMISRTKEQELGVNGLSFYGNVLFSLGPNTELGGTNDTPCHLDMPMNGCSLSLDGRPIVERGKIVVPEMQA